MRKQLLMGLKTKKMASKEKESSKPIEVDKNNE